MKFFYMHLIWSFRVLRIKLSCVSLSATAKVKEFPKLSTKSLTKTKLISVRKELKITHLSDKMDYVLDNYWNRNQNKTNDRNGPCRRLLQRSSSASSGHIINSPVRFSDDSGLWGTDGEKERTNTECKKGCVNLYIHTKAFANGE